MELFDSTKTRLYDLLREVQTGKIQLPDFQRGWIWDDYRIRSLLSSVAKSFPIGAVMLFLLVVTIFILVIGQQLQQVRLRLMAWGLAAQCIWATELKVALPTSTLMVVVLLWQVMRIWVWAPEAMAH